MILNENYEKTEIKFLVLIMINMESLWGLTIVTVCISYISHASPVPEPGITNPVVRHTIRKHVLMHNFYKDILIDVHYFVKVHSLATYATTNSFHYTNKLGTLNYRFSKVKLIHQKYHKLI